MKGRGGGAFGRVEAMMKREDVYKLLNTLIKLIVSKVLPPCHPHAGAKASPLFISASVSKAEQTITFAEI